MHARAIVIAITVKINESSIVGVRIANCSLFERKQSQDSNSEQSLVHCKKTRPNNSLHEPEPLANYRQFAIRSPTVKTLLILR